MNSAAAETNDKKSIDQLVSDFFKNFNNKAGPVTLEGLSRQCIDQVVITKNSGLTPEIYSLTEFMKPRIELLNSGSLIDFEEHELSARTDIHGHIAQRLSLYQKSGVQLGNAFKIRGIKVFQFIRTSTGWRISAMAWDDEREGMTLPDSL